ncbi:putative ABC transport system ATP-binding protein [Bifidobacterium bohemicum]|uniref:Putative tryptophan uptake ABC transporter ATP-binding protein n=1 Tax=Bifidobacterium bohemicum DSM 22767 TaxID=1437606 RepID=A0A086ZJT3_9BIFI|nr:ATP-binding cassette domain-containing protein [Bifidobacterium bohemicum]KFI46783.1 putative tryptophan uptake ABC transporter ATP-binding protein [Bifidobacterium bohemicum DSM 22767]SCB81364.1 putative ABC transport system ATP-binding protein [Bifidobacterium bohemicum]
MSYEFTSTNDTGAEVSQVSASNATGGANRLEMRDCTVIVDNGMDETKQILSHANLSVRPGQFVTVLGGNGAGKSTLFNLIAGSITPTRGQIFINGRDVTSSGEEARAAYIARVFQDPKMGTAPRMTVAENLLLAMRRGQPRRFKIRDMANNHERFLELCAGIGNGLEEQLETPAGNLSGGQRQALSLIMATITKPDLLLLDEHTAALDPKTSKQLMEITAHTITTQHLTCLMITHRLDDALRYGDRLIVLQKGRIVRDLDANEKRSLSMNDLLQFFEDGF